MQLILGTSFLVALPGQTNGLVNEALEAVDGTAVYLLLNGILGDRRPAGGNILTKAVYDELPVIYGAESRIGEAERARPKIAVF